MEAQMPATLTAPPRAARASARSTPALIRVAVLDDHAAVRAGVEAILGAAPDMVPVGSASGEEELHWLLQRADPSVLVVDVHHPGLHGLALSLQLKRRSVRPRIVLYSGRGGELVTVAAAVAGVDAIVAKSDTGQALLPAVALRSQGRAAARLDPADHGILAMRLAGHSWADIAATLRLPVAAVADRGAAIVIRLTSSHASAETLAA
jgi:FixJ family two-component response regulator